MSYLRPRAMSGVSSQPPGRSVSRSALGAISTGTIRKRGPDFYVWKEGMGATAIEYGTTITSIPKASVKAFGPTPSQRKLFQSVRHSSLGDDTLGVDAAGAPQQLAQIDSEAQWRGEMLASNKAILAAHKTWADGDKFQKWIAIGATLAIPLSAAIWRALGIGRRRKQP